MCVCEGDSYMQNPTVSMHAAITQMHRKPWFPHLNSIVF